MPSSLRILLALGLFLCFGAVPAAAQSNTIQGRTCGTPTPTAAEMTATNQAVAQWLAANDYDALRGDVVTIPVAFHVVAGGESVAAGNIPDQWIFDQMDVINASFLSMGYQFILASIDRTINPDWYFGLDLGTPEETAMKQALAIDPARFMNVYTVRPTGGILGWAYFPNSFPESNPLHGVVLLDQSLPGGNAAPYNLGDTGTHEVGHYVGLRHTFDFNESCTDGDGVDDTPAEFSPAFGCPSDPPRDSCPNDPGLDPIFNFMDYTDDACMNEFTPGQAERALALMNQFRPTIMENSGTFAAPELLAFGDIDVETSATLTATIVNLDSEDFEITEITSDNPAFSAAEDVPTVTSGSAVQLAVTFAPEEEGVFEGTLSLATDSEDVGTLEIALAGGGLSILPPALSVENPAILAAAEVGDETTATLTLDNAGPGTLIYAFDGFGRMAAPAARTTPSALPAVKGVDKPGTGAPARFGEGGPDAFGYAWIDSNEPGGPAADAYEDISGSGTAVTWTATNGNFPAEDEGYADVALPFSFSFYDESYDGLRLFTNGFMTFDQTYTDAAFSSFTNTAIPAPAPPNAALYPFWDDTSLEDGAAYVVANPDSVVVQYEAGRFQSTVPTYFFQVVLFPNGEIEYRYGDMSGLLTSATIGIENENGTVGLQVANNAAYLESGLTIRFAVETSFIAAITPASGTVEAGAQQEVEVTLSAEGLEEGVYQELLSLITNDPILPQYRVHTVFAVGGVLPPPALIAPAYGFPEVPVDLALSWTAVPNADSYDLEVATDEAFADVVFSGNIEDPEAVFAADPGATFFWRVRSVDEDDTSEWSLPFVFTTTTTTVASDPDAAPSARFALGAAYPNPANGAVAVPFTLEEPQSVTLQVFDVTGRLVSVVADDVPFGAGRHTLQWDGSALPNGVYLVRLTSAGQVATERVTVLR
jgi:hypothetical protein